MLSCFVLSRAVPLSPCRPARGITRFPDVVAHDAVGVPRSRNAIASSAVARRTGCGCLSFRAARRRSTSQVPAMITMRAAATTAAVQQPRGAPAKTPVGSPVRISRSAASTTPPALPGLAWCAGATRGSPSRARVQSRSARSARLRLRARRAEPWSTNDRVLQNPFAIGISIGGHAISFASIRAACAARGAGTP